MKDEIFDLSAFAPEVPDARDFGEARFVEFEARRVPSSRIAWLNDRWFYSHGIDLGDPTQKKVVSDWIIDKFGVSVPSSACILEKDYGEETVLLRADRYGGTGGGLHGGSGRCGTFGKFNAKGIGRTPLVSSESDWYHSHGCLWLEEAIREAITSEVVMLETPHGAVPVIAVIDLGIRIRWGDGSTGERRAIVVRPNFVRIAHFQRSIFFGSSGAVGTDQYLEEKAVSQLAARVFGGALGQGSASYYCGFSVLDSLLKVGEQIAYCRFHRLWAGPFYPSNSCIEGPSVDFGSFRTVRNWRKIRGALDAPSFGAEESSLLAAYVALLPTIRRAGGAIPKMEKLSIALRARVRRVFESECRKAINIQGNPPASQVDGLVRALTDLYEAEQRAKVSSDAGIEQRWLTNYLVEVTESKQGRNPVAEIAQRLINGLNTTYEGTQHSERDTRVSLATLQRTFSRRPLLEREALLARVLRLTSSKLYRFEHFENILSSFIEKNISRSRRIWRDLPQNLVVAGQRSILGSSFLCCINEREESVCVWIEFPRYGDWVWSVNKKISYTRFSEIDISTESSWVRGLIDLNIRSDASDLVDIPLPEMSYWYDRRRVADFRVSHLHV